MGAKGEACPTIGVQAERLALPAKIDMAQTTSTAQFDTRVHNYGHCAASAEVNMQGGPPIANSGTSRPCAGAVSARALLEASGHFPFRGSALSGSSSGAFQLFGDHV